MEITPGRKLQHQIDVDGLDRNVFLSICKTCTVLKDGSYPNSYKEDSGPPELNSKTDGSRTCSSSNSNDSEGAIKNTHSPTTDHLQQRRNRDQSRETPANSGCDDEIDDSEIQLKGERDISLLEILKHCARPFNEELWKRLGSGLKIYPFTIFLLLEGLCEVGGADSTITSPQSMGDAGAQSPDLSNIRLVYLNMKVQLSVWETWDGMDALLKYGEVHEEILKVLGAIELISLEPWKNWSETLICALERDRSDLSNVVHQMMIADRSGIVALPSIEIQNIMSLLQFLIDGKCSRRHVFERVIFDVVSKTGILPSRLFICGVRRVGRNPVMGGGFADVWRGELNGESVALKVLRLFQRGEADLDYIHKKFCAEAVIWQQLYHCNLLPFYGISEDEFDPLFAMISPWMKNGDLISFLRNNPNADKHSLVFGVASGLQYLHGLKPLVIHGDLRAANILVDDVGQPRITDFGLSKVVDSQASSIVVTSFSGKGTMRWQAPELLNAARFEGQSGGVTSKSDVYAFSFVCLEIFTGNIPFPDLRDGNVIMAVAVHNQRPPRPVDLDDATWRLMEVCWVPLPTERPTMDEVVDYIALSRTLPDTPPTLMDHASSPNTVDAWGRDAMPGRNCESGAAWEIIAPPVDTLVDCEVLGPPITPFGVKSLHTQRRGLQFEIGELLRMHANYGQASQLGPDWMHHSQDPIAHQSPPPLDLDPPPPDAPPPPEKPVWWSIHQRSPRKRKCQDRPPLPQDSINIPMAPPQRHASWSTWQPNPNFAPTPPEIGASYADPPPTPPQRHASWSTWQPRPNFTPTPPEIGASYADPPPTPPQGKFGTHVSDDESTSPKIDTRQRRTRSRL